VGSVLPGSTGALRGAARSEPKRPSWRGSGAAERRRELLRGEGQPRAAPREHQRAAAALGLAGLSLRRTLCCHVPNCICPDVLEEYHVNPNTDLFRKTKITALHLEKPPTFLRCLQVLRVTEQADDGHTRRCRMHTESACGKRRGGKLRFSQASKENEDIT